MSDDLRARIEEYARLLQEAINAHTAKNFPNLDPDTVSIDWNRKYTRIVKSNNGQRYVHTFVAMVDVDTKTITAKAGDILKAAGWKAPAKHPRGSVFNSDPLKGVGPYGADYLLGGVGNYTF